MAFASGTKGGIKVGFVELVPRAAAAVPNGALFLDSSGGNAPTAKNTGGSSVPIGEVAASDVLIKTWQNLSGVTIVAGKTSCKLASGSAALADADAVGRQVWLAVALDTVANTAQGRFALVGPNVAGALAGLGFAPGEAVYQGKTAGGYAALSTLNPLTDAIIRVGYADCAAGVASATAVDLIMFAEVISRP